jgi:son of sevenless-like protein
VREKAEKAERDRIKKEKGNKKLAKMLGEDVSHLPISPPPPPQPPIIPPVILQQQLQRQQSLSNSVDMRTPPSASFGHISLPLPKETPWYITEDYLPDELIFDDKGQVKAGTLKALVVRLTPHGSTGKSFCWNYGLWLMWV